jgi:hypothetical protein
MTRTERRRFIRTYYQLWALILLPEHQWPEAITPLTIKQVYLLREMCFIPLAIGPDPPSPLTENTSTWYRSDGKPLKLPLFDTYSSEGRRGQLGSLLQDRLTEHSKRMSTLGNKWEVDDYPWLIHEESHLEGFAGFHLIWDHGKDSVKHYCLARPSLKQLKQQGYAEPTEEELEYEQQHQWVESSEEEEG